MNTQNNSHSKELTIGPRARQVLEYLFAHPESTQKQIAAVMGISEQRIGHILRSPRVINQFPILARVKLKGLVPKAIKRFDELMSQKKNLEVSRKVSESVLNSEKVLEPQPLIQINPISVLKVNELKKIIQDNSELPQPSIDVDDLA